MINKKNVLGRAPEALGSRDAIHVAIVAVRAHGAIRPGERCCINEYGEAAADASSRIGVADPFLKTTITTGQHFWMLLSQDQISNVVHTWDHPSYDFGNPVREVLRNSWLEEIAKDFGVTYEQLMDACSYVFSTGQSAPYPASGKRPPDFEEVATYDLWSEWADETGHEFPNCGSECCPEYEHPECDLFK